MAHGLILTPEASYDCHVISIRYCLGGTSVNPLGIGGIVLVILGILFFINPDLFNYLLAIVFIVAGVYLTARGFGVNLP